MFAAFGTALHRCCLSFMSQAGVAAGVPARYGLQRPVLPVRNCRRIGKKDMKLNDQLAKIEIDPETFRVRLDGRLLPVDPAERLALTQRYFLY
jgi:urease subunit alpha